MSSLVLDASFLINMNRIGLGNLFFKLFNTAYITQFVHQEVVIKGLEWNKPDAYISKQQIDENKIRVIKVEKKYSQDLALLLGLHKGESSSIILSRKKNIGLGIDDGKSINIIMNKIPIFFTGKLIPFDSVPFITTLDIVVFSFQEDIISTSEALRFIRNLEQIGSFKPDTILEYYEKITQKEG
jgi:predicted nucleic acid-binding protein